MNIDGDGYLSVYGREKSDEICVNNEEILSRLEQCIFELRTFASSREVNDQNTAEDRQKVIALLLTVRLLEISESLLLIMKHGMSNEANSLFRVFLDAYFVFANVCTDASFVSSYFKSDEIIRLKLIEQSKKHHSEIFRRVKEYATKVISDGLRNKISAEEIKPFNSYEYARNVGCTEIYDSMYRILSGPLHTTPRSLEKYIEQDTEGNIVLIKDHPIEGSIPDRAKDLISFLEKVLAGLKGVFETQN